MFYSKRVKFHNKKVMPPREIEVRISEETVRAWVSQSAGSWRRLVHGKKQAIDCRVGGLMDRER
ncbi:hypothetical protein [Prosthecochloris sp.]|uniref:hypothetical protein n=1 Tax=Prosthecochloris sp. TaxID=290513 RepID=UPI00257C7BA7|nr:hypothetical protein [Prosthecochloris sp.]